MSLFDDAVDEGPPTRPWWVMENIGGCAWVLPPRDAVRLIDNRVFIGLIARRRWWRHQSWTGYDPVR